jgi:DNA polymerase-3 subunit gamma/tau
MRALMDLTHRVTVAQVSGGEPDVPTAEERAALGEFAQRLSPAQLHRLWQLLLKGHEEVRNAPDPLVSAQMALLRAMHAAEMPDPGKLSKKLEELAEKGIAPTAATAASGDGANASGTAPAQASVEWGALVQQIDDAGQLRIAQIMRDWIRVNELAPNKLVYSVKDGLGEDPGAELRDCLYRVTGSRWQVERGQGVGAPTLREQEEATNLAKEQEIREHPMVKATFEAFPDARLLADEDKVAQAGGNKWNR